MKNWFALDIASDPDATEAIESALNQLDALGTEIELFPKSKNEPQIVTGFFDVLPDDNDIRSCVDESLKIYGFDANSVKNISTRMVEEIDWLAEWKKYWKPTVVGKFVIAPPWEKVESEKIVISIEPNMAFGTGTHETTQLCLQAISDSYHGGQTLLDVGTGTGILAIAAAKLPTESTENSEKEIQILACDTDPDSIKIAKENAAANGVGEHIEFINGSLPDDIPAFDFVCANLIIDVIVPILPLLLEKTREKLVLSGILVEQQEMIAAELQKFKISNYKFEISGEWIAVVISMS